MLGSGVLDVAGGQGELAFELLNLNGVPTTILDPRQGWDIAKAAKLLESGQYHSTPALLRHVDVPLEDCRRQGPLFPRHERVFLDPALWGGDAESRVEAYENLCRRARRMEWRPRGLFARKSSGDGLASGADGDDGQLAPTPFSEFVELLANSSAIVGMHPDQAAGAIVDFAVAHNKPYALVPCCTFAKEFPKRCLASGRLVGSYEDLVQWLQELDPNSSVASLGFDGRNLAIYNTFAE